MSEKTTLILGGTGKTGRRIAQRLSTQGVPVRVASRSGTPPFDWNDPRTWEPTLRGVDSVYLAYPPDLAIPGAAEHINDLARQATRTGTKRIVLLSGRGEPQVLPAEKAVRESGAAFTILRCAFFSQNFSEGFLQPAILAGELAFPAGTVQEPFIDTDDIADVAVAALTSDAHAGKIYELTGPRLMTFAEAVLEIAAAGARPVRYRAISPEDFAADLSHVMPPEEATFLADLFRQILDGHNAHLDHDVERVLARKPRDFRDFARQAAAAGAWRE